MAVHPASSSSSNYEVFLSFHGKDVRNNFADNLYHALVDAGIRTFRDEDELPKGNEIGPELLAAIQQSSISIPVLSENYASSKWCLNELAEICECRRTMDQILFPIFYRVEPRDVRSQGGLYAKAFEKHQMRFHETTVQMWKKALKEAADLDGWHCKEYTREAELVKAVVRTVWSSLNKRPLNVSDNIIGMQSHIKELLRLLDVESDDRLVVGIHGLGGIGKTMIAKVVYNTVFHHFQGYSFIENIQENYGKHGLIHLQNQLILDILKQEKQNIGSVDRKFVIRQRFCRKKVLIVLDDVDQKIQAESLVGNGNWFGCGSKIIITSRNKDILCALGVDKFYEPNVMDLDDSLQLFSHHAFKTVQPSADYWDISKAIVETTGGLPLALEAIGSSLFLKEKTKWEAMLKKLQKVPHDEVVKRLVISYDGLNEEEQQMFLDIACFFIGMNKDIACHIWDGCGYSSQAGLDAFCARSLVTISKEGVLRMHNQVRDLGRQIVYQESIDEPGKRTRIWSKKEVLEVLYTQAGTTNVKGICCTTDFSDISSSQCLMSEGFATMRKLRFLQVDYAHFFGNLFTHCFSELRWLSWKGCADRYAQTNFWPQKLAVLDLSHGEITENWIGWNRIKMAVKLKVLNLTSSCWLSSTPDLSANRQLEVLILKDCSSLVEINPSIGYLRNLVTLDMSGCIIMVTLPMEICQLTSLKRLDLKKCKNLKMLPYKLDLLISLKELDLSFCYKLESLINLPLSLTSLDVSDCSSIQYILDLPSSLISLSACGCKSMVRLSSSTSGLRNLERLYLDGCNNLEEIQGVGDEGLDSLVLFRMVGCVTIPIKICKLTALRRLDLKICESITKLPDKLDLLISLTELDLSFCYKLESLTHLPLRLTSLDVIDCHSIQYISDLPLSLISLSARGCKSLVKLSSTSGLRNLERLYLDGCHSLEEIQGDDEGLDSLVLLTMVAKSLKKLPNLSNSKRLRELLISDCHKLSKIECLENCESLETLTICNSSMERLPDLSNLNRMQVLTIECLPELTEIQGLNRLESLRDLKIKECGAIGRIPDLSSILNVLKIEGCTKLTEIHGVDRLEFLNKLEICGCKSLERLPDLSNLKRLNDLKIEGCRIPTAIHGVDRLEFLEKLDITGCQSLERLPNLTNLIKLEQLRANGCKKLTEIHGIDRLVCLQKLEISGFESLEILPDLSNLKSLNDLRILGCKKLTEIHGVDRMEFLKKLEISGCESLERLPNLSNLKSLNGLWILGCKKLSEIHGVDRMEFLKKLEISGCESLKRLPNLSNLKSLNDLRIQGCKKLTEIHGVDRMKFLVNLDITGCQSLDRLPDLSSLTKLKQLRAHGCKKLTNIHGVDRLTCLDLVDISGCETLRRLPDLSNSKSLNVIKIEGCRYLTEIYGISGLDFIQNFFFGQKFIKKLDVSGCKFLRRLPDLSNFNNLKELRAEGCKKLIEIPGVDRLEFLELLDISGCGSLERLPDLSNLKNLKELRAVHCLMLSEIKAVNGLESLERLHIWGCKALKEILDLTNLNKFWDLNKESCWESTANARVYRFRVELLDTKLRPCFSNLAHALSDYQHRQLRYHFSFLS